MDLQTLLIVVDPSFYPIESAIQNRMFTQFPAIPAQYLSDVNKAAGKQGKSIHQLKNTMSSSKMKWLTW
jgi:hypothetical protein